MARKITPRDMIDKRISSFDYMKKTKTIKRSEIVDKMLENIMKDIEEGKIKKEDIKNMANIIAEKKLKALTPEKFEKYEKQEKFLRDLYDDIPPKEQDKKFFVNTFERYWKIYQDQYVKKGQVPTDYSLFPRDISEAIKRGQITTKDIEIVMTPSGIEYKTKKPISLLVPEEKPSSGIQIRIFEGEKTEEKTEEKPKEEKPKEEDEDKHVAFKIGKNKFYVKGFNEYIVKVRKLEEDKWMAEAEELYGSLFPYEGAEYEKAKGRTLEQALDNISDRIDFRGVFPLEEEEKPEILEQRISEIKKMKQSKPSITAKTFVSQAKKEELPKGIEVRTFVPQTMKEKEEIEKELPKPAFQIKAEEKETKPGIQIRVFGSEEKEKIDNKAKETVESMVEQVEERVKEMIPETPKPKSEGKREKKLRAKEEEVVDKIIEEWSGSKELRPLTEDFLIRNLPKVAEKRPDVAREILEKTLKKEEPKTEFLEAFRILSEKRPEASFELLKEWQKAKIQEARDEIKNKIDLDIKKTKQGVEVEGIIPERSVFLTEGKQSIVMPTYLYLDLEEKKLKMQQEMLERKRKEQEEKLKKMEEEKRKREEAQKRELEEFYRSRGIRSSINEAETLAEPVKMVMETPKTVEMPSVSQREIPAPNFIERFASGVKPVVEKTRPAVKSFVSEVEKGIKSFAGVKPAEVTRAETVSAIENVEGIPYQIETEYAEKGGFMKIKETRKNLLTGSVKVEEKLLPKSPVEVIKQSVPARLIKAVIPTGTPQMRRWLHSQAGSVRPISRELDWRKVEMRRLRLASRR